ncbi:predicted protein [Phaeodactylum tricornutum CCAP 1055/1]|jgi:hypothetical protein|uniref:Uncharacterized protein n=1 Tax=Phaeodactylum tricornutum (strain CCAP 1055/1) TaxID=556484 RepID=B7G6P6_PHATC|nr:predicted protein [Phaeodactylum tricornutum CCAP 1055/1]EEC45629.1 predicted protein [Phaeodactylum tricornutum CCAP 1055/1]|eukprot:XP_002182893.1 predicted protein [Phaeodactylum tricornutum CCAP 1055/1]
MNSHGVDFDDIHQANLLRQAESSSLVEIQHQPQHQEQAHIQDNQLGQFSCSVLHETSIQLLGIPPVLDELMQAQTTASTSLPQTPSLYQGYRSTPIRRMLSDREQFLIFVKILFKCLERADDKNLRQRAKTVVSECTRRNRLGDSQYTPLQEAVERRLKRIVGELYWCQAQVYTNRYCRQKGLVAMHQTAVPV